MHRPLLLLLLLFLLLLLLAPTGPLPWFDLVCVVQV
jgi:hypothetical protein